jgi:signal transduction histidine kinase
MLLVVIVLLISCFFLKLLINKVLIHELDEELNDVKASVLLNIGQTRTIPENSILYNYQLESSIAKDSAEGTHYVTTTRYIQEKSGTRNFRQLVFFVRNHDTWYRLGVEKQIEGVKIMGRTLIGLSLMTMLFVIGMQLFINKLILKRLWNPFYKTLSIMRNFQINKEHDLEFPRTNIEEFSYMNEILKNTTQKAGQDYIALKEFTENASHELQTPLSIISSKLDILIQDEQISKRQNQTIAGAIMALKRMKHLNQSLLLLAKIGNRQFSDIQTIALKEKIKEKTEQFYELWQDQHLVVEKKISTADLKINPDLCEILINNLFSNATKHNLRGGYISIDLSPGNLSITNSGISTALDQQKIFRRFYKSDQSSIGNGLGLSIIKQICEVSSVTVHYIFESNKHKFLLSWSH